MNAQPSSYSPLATARQLATEPPGPLEALTPISFTAEPTYSIMADPTVVQVAPWVPEHIRRYFSPPSSFPSVCTESVFVGAGVVEPEPELQEVSAMVPTIARAIRLANLRFIGIPPKF